MESKSDIIRKHLQAGNDREALRVAAKFFDRSEDTSLYKRAHEALINPAFYKQLGVDVELTYSKAVENLRERFLNGQKTTKGKEGNKA